MKTTSTSLKLITVVMFLMLGSLSTGMAQNSKPNKIKPTIVLVHGAWADGSSWNKVIPILEKNGYHTVAVQNPLTSLEDDVAAVNRILKEVQGDVILVGHSWAGVVITEAGIDPKVKSLVYIAAYAPDLGQSIESIHKDGFEVKKYPKSPVTENDRVVSDGFIRLKDATVLNYFAQDIPRPEAELIAVGQGRFHVSTLSAKVSNLAWKNKPSFYVVADHDKIIPPQIEADMAEHIGAKTYHVLASHVAMLAKPQKVAEVILEAASAN